MHPEQSLQSRQIFERATEVMPGGNSRHGVFLNPFPAYADHASGCRVTDVDGVERIDCVNNWSSLIHGHGHPAIVEALRNQAGRLMAAGMPTESEVQLAELLADRLPGVDQLHFSNSGSEAVLFAVRAARAFTGRSAIAKVEGAYHGNIDAVTVSVAPFGIDAGPDHAPHAVPSSEGIPASVLDDTVVLPFNDADASEALIRQHADRLAAVLIDPLVSRMGLVEATPEYLSRLRAVTEELGVLLIFDEVFSFRLGYHGAQGLYEVTPDLTALGKIIGGGMPVGATGGRADVMAVFDQTRTPLRVEHGGTYNANPMTMVAGLACMSLMTREAFEALDQLGDHMRQGLTAALKDAGLAGTVRGRGSLVGLSLTDTPVASFRDLQFGPEQRQQLAHLHGHLYNSGVLMVPYGMFILSTPMTVEVIDVVVGKVAEALSEIARGGLAQRAG